MLVLIRRTLCLAVSHFGKAKMPILLGGKGTNVEVTCHPEISFVCLSSN